MLNVHGIYTDMKAHNIKCSTKSRSIYLSKLQLKPKLLLCCLSKVSGQVQYMVFAAPEGILAVHYHRCRKWGAGGATLPRPPPRPPNFTHCLYNELHCSIVMLLTFFLICVN